MRVTYCAVVSLDMLDETPTSDVLVSAIMDDLDS